MFGLCACVPPGCIESTGSRRGWGVSPVTDSCELPHACWMRPVLTAELNFSNINILIFNITFPLYDYRMPVCKSFGIRVSWPFEMHGTILTLVSQSLFLPLLQNCYSTPAGPGIIYIKGAVS